PPRHLQRVESGAHHRTEFDGQPDQSDRFDADESSVRRGRQSDRHTLSAKERGFWCRKYLPGAADVTGSDAVFVLIPTRLSSLARRATVLRAAGSTPRRAKPRG